MSYMQWLRPSCEALEAHVEQCDRCWHLEPCGTGTALREAQDAAVEAWLHTRPGNLQARTGRGGSCLEHDDCWGTDATFGHRQAGALTV